MNIPKCWPDYKCDGLGLKHLIFRVVGYDFLIQFVHFKLLVLQICVLNSCRTMTGFSFDDRLSCKCTDIFWTLYLRFKTL